MINIKNTKRLSALIGVLLSVVAIVLEASPSVTLFFPDGAEVFEKNYSYFSVIPFGYGVFGPLPIAVGTCLLAAVEILAIIQAENRALSIACCFLSDVVAIFSLYSVVFLWQNVSFVGLAVFLLLLGSFAAFFVHTGTPRPARR